jgi:hypothetical protein
MIGLDWKLSLFVVLNQFVNRAIKRPIYLSEGGIRCPCVKCKCINLNTPPMVRYQLYKHGFRPNYWFGLIMEKRGQIFIQRVVRTVAGLCIIANVRGRSRRTLVKPMKIGSRHTPMKPMSAHKWYKMIWIASGQRS